MVLAGKVYSTFKTSDMLLNSIVQKYIHGIFKFIFLFP